MNERTRNPPGRGQKRLRVPDYFLYAGSREEIDGFWAHHPETPSSDHRDINPSCLSEVHLPSRQRTGRARTVLIPQVRNSYTHLKTKSSSVAIDKGMPVSNSGLPHDYGHRARCGIQVGPSRSGRGGNDLTIVTPAWDANAGGAGREQYPIYNGETSPLLLPLCQSRHGSRLQKPHADTENFPRQSPYT